MIVSLLGLIILCGIYYFLYNTYIKYIGPNLPETTWKWVRQPTPLQFVLAVIILTMFFRKVN